MCHNDSQILTDFQEVEPPYDDGVEHVFRAEESFVLDGEQVERETTVRLLEDGGVQLDQQILNQDIFETMTLNAAIARRLRRELEVDA